MWPEHIPDSIPPNFKSHAELRCVTNSSEEKGYQERAEREKIDLKSILQDGEIVFSYAVAVAQWSWRWTGLWGGDIFGEVTFTRRFLPRQFFSRSSSLVHLALQMLTRNVGLCIGWYSGIWIFLISVLTSAPNNSGSYINTGAMQFGERVISVSVMW